MRLGRALCAGLWGVAAVLTLSLSAQNGGAARGKELFERRCSGCHALDINKEGPRLRNVFGNQSAGVPEFGYSESLRSLRLRWDKDNLDRWLTDPEAMAPGTDMAFRMANMEERRVVIAFLESLRTAQRPGQWRD